MHTRIILEIFVSFLSDGSTGQTFKTWNAFPYWFQWACYRDNVIWCKNGWRLILLSDCSDFMMKFTTWFYCILFEVLIWDWYSRQLQYMLWQVWSTWYAEYGYLVWIIDWSQNHMEVTKDKQYAHSEGSSLWQLNENAHCWFSGTWVFFNLVLW